MFPPNIFWVRDPGTKISMFTTTGPGILGEKPGVFAAHKLSRHASVVGGSWKGQGQGRLQEVSGIFHGSLWRMVALLCGQKMCVLFRGHGNLRCCFFWLVVIVIGLFNLQYVHVHFRFLLFFI